MGRFLPRVNILRGTAVRLDGDRYIDAWRWHHSRGFTISIGDTLVMVSFG